MNTHCVIGGSWRSISTGAIFAGIAFLSMNAFVLADEVDDYVLRQMAAKRIPGAQLAVVQNNRIVKTANYGIANIQDAVPVRDETVFTINSMTKSFVGVAVMQLVEAGKIKLDAAISTYLLDLPGSWQAVTVEQLLTHTSGLPKIMGNGVQLISSEGEESSWQLVQQLPLESVADTRFSYNQTNYLLIGKIIDRVSGQPFVEFIQEKQLQRVGMKKTAAAGFAHFEDVIPHQARGYTYYQTGKLTTATALFTPGLRAAAGMSSSASELASWLIALQTGELLKDPSSVATLWTPAVLGNNEIAGFDRLLNGYALGWQVMQRQTHSAVASVGGNRAAMVVYPDDGLAVIVLSNLMGALPERFIDEIAGFYVPDLQLENGFGLSTSANALREGLASAGFASAIETAESLQRTDGVLFNEDELNAWGYRLINHLEVDSAMEIFRLNTHLFPHSANTFDSLGEAYGLLGQTQAAIDSYKKALKLDPASRNAARQLDRLGRLLH